jgi:hypothetical protein
MNATDIADDEKWNEAKLRWPTVYLRHTLHQVKT